MFEREIRQKLANSTILKILGSPKEPTDTTTKAPNSLFF
ncbi:hypothetical protein [uncultured Gammaproteobacteria bacterium]|nr:hypothetical protein [uncultured Gammaproteobacteria bacterium]